MGLPVERWFPEGVFKYPEDSRYICQCLTCNIVFLDESFKRIKELIGFRPRKGDETRVAAELLGRVNWNTWNPQQQKWYIAAARHWIESGLQHQLKMIMTHKDKEELKQDSWFDLTADWTRQIPQQMRMLGLKDTPEGKVKFREAMLLELKDMEDRRSPK